MTGDQQDMLARLRAVLPGRWFPDQAPVLDGLLNGLSAAWSWAYDQLQYVKAQTRITSTSDIWLDIVAQDFFGASMTRRAGQSDDVFRQRIQQNLFRERGTRGAIIAELHDLTGRVPNVFEPARPTDTGGYGSLTAADTGLAYGAAGGWGDLGMPFQCFIAAYRPIGIGIAAVTGWGSPMGGYGQGTIEYGSLAMLEGQVTDDDIYAAIAGVLPVATIGWTSITS